MNVLDAGLAAMLAGVALSLDRSTRALGAAIVACGVVAAIAGHGSARTVNPDVYPAFRTVEHRCAAEVPMQRTKACDGAMDLVKRCAGETCSAPEYHAELSRLGFALPTLYR